MAYAQLQQELEESKSEIRRLRVDVPRNTDSSQGPFIILAYPEVVRFGFDEFFRRIHFNPRSFRTNWQVGTKRYG